MVAVKKKEEAHRSFGLSARASTCSEKAFRVPSADKHAQLGLIKPLLTSPHRSTGSSIVQKSSRREVIMSDFRNQRTNPRDIANLLSLEKPALHETALHEPQPRGEIAHFHVRQSILVCARYIE